MSLSKLLKKQSYDLIAGPTRNHKPLQLWVKKPFNKIGFYFDKLSDAFQSNVALEELTNDALTVNASDLVSYDAGVGLGILESLLRKLGAGNIGLASKISKIKQIEIGYEHAVTSEVPSGVLEQYLNTAQFDQNNKSLLHNANRNNIILVSGVLFAKNFKANIETSAEIDVSLAASLNNSFEGKAEFSKESHSNITMISKAEMLCPIAVKAYKVCYQSGNFKRLGLFTDVRSPF